ncbi:hypothetical protein COOONC_08523 [Cooperia oncophora]
MFIANKLSVEGVSQGFLSGTATAQEKAISYTSVQNVGFNSVQIRNSCSDSQRILSKIQIINDNVLIGISLYNTEVQPFAVYPDKKTQQMFFTRQIYIAIDDLLPSIRW